MDGKRPKERMKGIGAGHHPNSIAAGKKNVIPINSRPIEEQKVIREKGIKASIESRQKRKTIAESIEIALKSKVPGQYGDIKEICDELFGAKKNRTNIDGLVGALFRELYSEGNRDVRFDRMKAFELIRDQVGENPETAVEQRSNMLLEFGNAMRTGLNKEDIEKDAEQGGHVDDVDTNIVQG